MKYSLRWLSGIACVFTAVLIFARPAQSKTLEHRIYRVARVIDGDTIKLDNAEHVGLIGIDAPEIKDGPKLERDLRERHLTKSVELAMGRKAAEFTRHLIEGKKVRLTFDVRRYDEYHRLLAYVYLLDGMFVNAEIVKAGYAYPYTIKPDVRYARLFQQLYKQAKENHRGLWQQQGNYKKRFEWFGH